MPNIFCSSCGTKHTYESSKPNFCTNCGSSLNPMQQAFAQKSARQKELEGRGLIVDENICTDDVPDVNEIKKSIVVIVPKNQKESLGSIIQNSPKSEGNANAPTRRGYELGEGESIFDRMKKECSTSRAKVTDINDTE